jgi:predicted alpha/beta superfamily hydrolase
MARFLVILQVLFCLSVPAFAQGEAGDVVIGQGLTLDSEVLGETRTIKVWLPENYAESGEVYPVFYLLDAEMVMRFAKAAATVAELGGDAMPEMIVVGIENIDRNKDMFPGQSGNEGGADKFLGFLTGELFPFVEARYRTAPYRILTGHSNSALFVSYALLRQPEAFNAYFAISPMLGHREQEMLTLARHAFPSFPQRNTFLYIQYGEHDFVRVVDVVPEFIDILENANPAALSHRVDVLPGEGHVPYSCYRDALVALFPDFRIKPGDLGRGLGYIDAYYQGLSQRYGFDIKTPAEPMIEYGRLMLDEGDYEKAIEAFKLASVRHPTSASAYFRLGRAYDAAGKVPEALAAYRQLLQIYPQSNTIQARVSELEKSIAE